MMYECRTCNTKCIHSVSWSLSQSRRLRPIIDYITIWPCLRFVTVHNLPRDSFDICILMNLHIFVGCCQPIRKHNHTPITIIDNSSDKTNENKMEQQTFRPDMFFNCKLKCYRIVFCGLMAPCASYTKIKVSIIQNSQFHSYQQMFH